MLPSLDLSSNELCPPPEHSSRHIKTILLLSSSDQKQEQVNVIFRPVTTLKLFIFASLLGLVAVFARSHMNGSILFKRTVEQTTETLPLTASNAITN